MSWRYELWNKVRFLFRQSQFDGELDEEMRQHLELKEQKLIDTGVPPAEARYRARREFGNIMQLRESSRMMWQWRPLEELAQDLRYALRLMRRSPAFTVVAVVSLALGIGANTAVFSVMDTVILKSLPVADPRQLVLMTAECNGQRWIFKNPTFRDLCERQRVFSGVFAISDEPHMLVAADGGSHQDAAYVPSSIVSGNYFSVLGVRPLIGRMFTEADDRMPGTGGVQERVAVISYGFWQRQYGGDPAAVGKKLMMGRQPYTIVGVTPREFRGHQAGYAPDIWAPMNQVKSPEELNQRNWAFFSGVMARLKPGVSAPQAQAAMTGLYQQVLTSEIRQGIQNSLWADGPSVRPDTNISDYRIGLKPGGGGLSLLRDRYAQSLRIIMAVVGLVLLIACSNVANLLLARATARRGEIGLRLALGSGRFRLMRQLLTESVLLAILGGAGGLLVAYWMGDALAGFISVDWLPMSLDVRPDARAFIFTMAVCFAAALLFGLAPAWQATEVDVAPALKGSSRSQTDSRPRQRLSRILLVSQIALSLLLMIGAGLLARTMSNLHHIDPGFRLQNVLMLDVHLENLESVPGKPDFGIRQKKLVGLYHEIGDRLNALTGVRSASVSWLGIFGGDDLSSDVTISGIAGKWPLHEDYVSSRYFETLGMQILLGRGFEARDNERSQPVAVVNEALARKYFPGENPLGRLLTVDVAELKNKPLEIVGVVRDAKYADLRAPVEPMFYAPIAQAPFPVQSIEVRTAGDPTAMAAEVKRVLRGISPDIMVRRTTTLDRRVDGTLVRERMLAELSGIFGVLAVVLACVGLYGSMSYAVSRRTGEIGIRLALGAGRRQVLWLVMRDALLLVGAGVAIGVPAALACGRLVAGFLFGLKAADPLTIVGAVLVMAGVAVLAGYLPARRAAQVDPTTALRYE